MIWAGCRLSRKPNPTPPTPPMNFTEALDAIITEALEDEDTSLADVIFDLGQAQLNLRLAVLQADADEADDDAE